MSSLCVRARANRSSVSGCVQAHVPQVPHLSSKLPLLTNCSNRCVKIMYIRSVRCSPRKSTSDHVANPRFANTRGAICVVHTAQIACRAPRAKKRAGTVAYYMCGAHHTDGTSSSIRAVCATKIACARRLCGAHHTNGTSSRIRAVYTT